jgi:murein DD-endopeptidase
MLRLQWKSLVLPALAVAAALSTGCANAPSTAAGHSPGRVTLEPRTVDDPRKSPKGDTAVGGAIADVAMGMVGTRYRYGGADPIEGFDCSGLVHYAYEQAGYRVPRTSQDLFRAVRKIAVGEADPGDLMFFQDQTKLSHVGIYLGDGLFVHAPANGQNVTVASLDSPYYQAHLVAVGRLLPH